MKFIKLITKIWEFFTIKVPLSLRIILCVVLAGGIASAIILPLINPQDNEPSDRAANKENVYLYEEVEFADEIFIKVTGISAIQENGIYTLNLQVRIEQWHTDFNVNQQEIRPDMFELRLVDMYARSPMSVFVQSLTNATISAIASGAIGGEINVIEETIGFAGDYIIGLIENSTSEEGRTIRARDGAFEPYYPYLANGVPTFVELSFELNDDFLNSMQTMVLSIDDGLRRIQKNIFLVLRPDTLPYSIEFDLDGGTSESLNNSINVDAAQIIDIPEEEPIKEGYKFLYWTLEKGKKNTKLRDLYLFTYEENMIFIVYAYYQEKIPLDEFTNINEFISLKDGKILVKVSSAYFSEESIIQNSNHEIMTINPHEGYKYLVLEVVIKRTSTGDNHTLDNTDDFYLENDHAKQNVDRYYGYTSFNSIKPVNDYSWIGMKINDIREYDFTLLFEVPSTFNFEEQLSFLEVDFFIGKNADSILIR